MASLGVPHTSASHLVTSSSSTSRSKVALKPGYSLLNWIKLGNSKKDLTGTGGKALQVTSQELRKHRRLEDCWTCIKGRVYNLSHYLYYHPGGVSEIMRAAGIDATSLFIEIHSWVNEMKMLEKCVVGHLIVSPVFLVPSSISAVPHLDCGTDTLSPTVQRKVKLLDNLSDPCWQEATLHSVVSLTKDTKLFTFQLPTGVSMHIPIGYHLHLKVTLPSSQQLLRSYTPVDSLSGDSILRDSSQIPLIVKTYTKGPLSSYLNQCTPGQVIHLSRPEGTFDFSDLKTAKHLLLLATGTGVTPMTRIVRRALESESILQTHLVYGNKRLDLSIWLEEFKQLAELHPDTFKLTTVFSEESEKIDPEFVNKIISQYPDPTSGELFVCVCGQTDFLTNVSQALLALKMPSDSVYTFW